MDARTFFELRTTQPYSRLMKLHPRALALLLPLLLAFTAPAQQMLSLSWQPSEITNGAPVLFTVEAPKATSVSGKWQNQPLAFFHTSPTSNTWYAIAGVDVEVAPGTYPVTIEAVFPGTVTVAQTLDRNIHITAAPYQQIPLTVPDKFVAPDAAAQKIIAHDKILKDKAYGSPASTPLWSGRFTPPLRTAASTDSFGTRRVFNGKLDSVHRGLDYRAKKGTPVKAVNSGRVVLARPLYYEGGCVIIDHGQGLWTQYMHLSNFRVKEGQRVTRGQIIALSGGTGRVTGPHLHLGVRWRDTSLDASKLFELDLPQTPRPASTQRTARASH